MLSYKAFRYLPLLLPALTQAGSAPRVYNPTYKPTGHYRVAVIDTGVDVEDPRVKPYICKDHTPWDFNTEAPMISDRDGHGTHVIGLIQKYAGSAKYCLLIYSFWEKTNSGHTNLDNEIAAIYQAISERADIVNLSVNGPTYSEEEKAAIESAPNVRFIVAAGNDNYNIDYTRSYPASLNLPNISVVGGLNTKCTEKSPSSNFGGRIANWELGVAVTSYATDGGTTRMTGTSQATAIHTGKTIARTLGSPCVPEDRK